MKYLFFKKALLLAAMILISATMLFGQSGNNQKFKPPVVKTTIGIRSDGDKVTREEASQLIGLPLKIKDDNGNEYAISSYQFVYKRKSFIENSETGKPEISFTTLGQRFDHTPLPKLWVDNIRTNLQGDEELFFTDIIVKDKSGRVFYAPSIKLKIN